MSTTSEHILLCTMENTGGKLDGHTFSTVNNLKLEVMLKQPCGHYCACVPARSI